jgi:hypothetical protein
MPVGAQDDTDPFQRQSKLEPVDQNKISNFPVVRCGNNFVVKLSVDGAHASRQAAIAAFPSAIPLAEWIALQ